MNRTITSNIAGYVFHIDEDAYDKLDAYLNTIRSYFTHSEGKDEIIADIEARLAEMLHERMGNMKQVVTLVDVNEVILIMGQPEAFIDDDAENTDWTGAKTEAGSTAPKRLFRDTDNKVIGGVCSGISNYLGIADPIWLRLALVVTFFAFGTGFLLYLILLIIIPEAKTTAEKLQMRGENVTVSNIEKRVNEELEAVKNKWNDLHGNSGIARKVGNLIHRVITLLGNIVLLTIRFFGKLIGIVFIICGIIGLFSLLSIPLGLPTFVSIGHYGGMSSVDIQHILHNLVGGSGVLGWMMVAGFLVWGIPLLALILLGIKLLFRIRTRIKGVGLVFLGLWIIGLFMSFSIGTFIATDFSSEGSKTESVELPLSSDPDQVINLALNHALGDDEPKHAFKIANLNLLTSGNSIDLYGKPQFTINMAKTGGPKLIIKRLARAKKKQDAVERANKIDYGFVVNDTALLLNGYFEIPEDELWRKQQVELELLLPVGYTVHLSDELTQIIYDISNTTNTYDGNMVNHAWTMTPEGLACVDCESMNITKKTTNVDVDIDVNDVNIRIQSKDKQRELEKKQEQLERKMKEHKEELEKIQQQLEKEDESSDNGTSSFYPKEIVLRRIINATYWITPSIQRTVRIVYPG